MTESQTTERRGRGGKAFAKISNLIPATSMFSQDIPTQESQMAVPRFYTHIPLDRGGGTVYSKVPPIGSTNTGSARMIQTSVSPRQVQIELESQDHHQNGQELREASSKNKRKEEATALAYNIMALDRHDLDLLAKTVQKSDFYVNAGKRVLTRTTLH